MSAAIEVPSTGPHMAALTPAVAVFFMMGSATVPFHKEAGERIREWWPNSEHYVVPGATHALQVVEPAGVAKGLAEFITRH